MRRWLTFILLGTALPQSALAARLFFVWDFDRTYIPQPSVFVVTYTNPAGQTLDQMETAPSAPGACAPPAPPTPETYCTVWPVCPPPDVVMTFWVQARWSDGQLSARSELLLCLFTVEQPCVCQDPATYTPPPPPVAATPPTPLFRLPARGRA